MPSAASRTGGASLAGSTRTLSTTTATAATGRSVLSKMGAATEQVPGVISSRVTA